MRQRTVQVLSIGLFLTLLVWGLLTLLIYLGVPVHTQVLTERATNESLQTLCASGSFFCRGAYSLFAFLWHTITREHVFIWYTVVCAALFAMAVLWNFVRRGQWELSWQMTPWKLVLMFIGMVWILFTCMTMTQVGTVPFKTIVEPKAEVYQGAGPEALAALSKNYEQLKERGCLTRIGTFGNVAEASDISMVCLQSAFFTRVLPPMLFVLLFFFELAIAGRLVLKRLLRIRTENPLVEFVLSLGVGVGAWIILLWLGAVFHIYTAYFGWGLALAIPLIGWRHAQYWMQRFLTAKWHLIIQPYSLLLLLMWFLLSYLAFNYMSVVRPFPIGWDDLGSYLNRPRLLVSYGSFVYSMASFQWEYLTSLGFLLFGYGSFFGATNALMINWTQGLLAILAIYMFGRVFLGPGRGILAATLYYALPLVGHFSYADMKIDNAVFVMGALATFCVFDALFREENQSQRRHWLLLAGVFAGLAFSMKVTAIMVMMAMLAVLGGVLLHWLAFPAVAVLSGAIFVKQGALNVPRMFERLAYGFEATPQAFTMLCIIAGTALAIAACWLARKHLKTGLLSGLFFVLGFGAMVFPWVQHNNILHGNVVPKIALKAPNNLTPFIDQFGNVPEKTPYSLPPELAVDINHKHCKSTAGKEELDRYWGRSTGWGHYFKLPWRSVMNLDHAGYYVTTQPALLLFPLLLLLPFFWRTGGRWVRWLWISTVYLVVQWMFLANGVPWYGIGVFLGLVLCLEVLVAKAPDQLNRTLAVILITCGIIICLGMRFWQYNTQRNMLEYPLGKISAVTLRERTIPYYDDITDIVIQRHTTVPDRPLLYRIGTFMPYFVPRNLEVIGVTDHQLDFFNCLHQDRDVKKTRERLKILGFNSLVFDTNTATIEKDPNGTLHQKVQTLVDFLNSPDAGMQMVINDPEAGITFMLIP